MGGIARRQVVSGHSFIVGIGRDLFSFSKISNLEAQIEYETVTEGGSNDYPHLFQKGRSHLDTLILERGVAVRQTDRKFDGLVEGMHLNEVTIMLHENKNLQKAFYFQWGVIVKRRFSDLDALRNELLIASLEIAHSGLIEIPVPNRTR